MSAPLMTPDKARKAQNDFCGHLSGGGVLSMTAPPRVGQRGRRKTTMLPKVYQAGHEFHHSRSHFDGGKTVISPAATSKRQLCRRNTTLLPKVYARGHESADTDSHFQGGTMLIKSSAPDPRPATAPGALRRRASVLPHHVYATGHENKDTEDHFDGTSMVRAEIRRDPTEIDARLARDVDARSTRERRGHPLTAAARSTTDTTRALVSGPLRARARQRVPLQPALPRSSGPRL